MKTLVKTGGINMPPHSPWNTRSAIITSMLVLRAQPRLAMVNPNVAAANIQRRVKARVSSPVSGMAITSAIR